MSELNDKIEMHIEISTNSMSFEVVLDSILDAVLFAKHLRKIIHGLRFDIKKLEGKLIMTIRRMK